MKLRDFGPSWYVYSTSYRFCFPFPGIPATTVGPIDGDLSKAISFLWKREHRGLLPQIHREVYSAALSWGLEKLYNLSVLAMAYQKVGSSPDGMKILSAGAKESGDEFPLSDLILQCLQSFAPSKWPNPEVLKEQQQFWVDAVVNRKFLQK
jgi:hypothetical protein